MTFLLENVTWSDFMYLEVLTLEFQIEGEGGINEETGKFQSK